jgi:hypothetical protein
MTPQKEEQQEEQQSKW